MVARASRCGSGLADFHDAVDVDEFAENMSGVQSDGGVGIDVYFSRHSGVSPFARTCRILSRHSGSAWALATRALRFSWIFRSACIFASFALRFSDLAASLIFLLDASPAAPTNNPRLRPPSVWLIRQSVPPGLQRKLATHFCPDAPPKPLFPPSCASGVLHTL
jgi:hypothetical protein